MDKEYLLRKEQVSELDDEEKFFLTFGSDEDQKVNKAILFTYLYEDELEDEEMKEKPRCSYVIYAVAGTEVGDEISRYLDSDETETDFIELDKVLTKAFGITDADCCFYILDLEDSSIEAIKQEVLDANNMVVLETEEVIFEEK